MGSEYERNILQFRHGLDFKLSKTFLNFDRLSEDSCLYCVKTCKISDFTDIFF